MSNTAKTVLISTVSLVLVAAITIGLFWILAGQGDPVPVTPVSEFTLGYWNENIAYDGTVSTNNLQPVYLSETQLVTDIYVKMGQKVKKGDPLFRYDTTLSDIHLARQKLAVEQAQMDLANAKAELEHIKNMKPYTPPPVTRPTSEPTTKPLDGISDLPYLICGSGSRGDPYRYLWSEGLSFTTDFIMPFVSESNPEVYFAFEIRESNALGGKLRSIWGMGATLISSGDAVPEFRYSFFTPEIIDHVTEDEAPTVPTTEWVDTSSGYTAAEIATMRKEKELQIRDINLRLRMAEVSYEKMRKEADSGVVKADISGTVTQLLTAETALSMNEPMIVISEGGTFYVTITLGEYERENYKIGSMATITSWMDGTEATAVLASVSQQPTTDGYYSGTGNPDVSLYEATLVVEAEAMLEEGEWVSVRFGEKQEQSTTIYLESAYVRDDNGRSYVYKRGADGRLEKTYVETGAVVWGYTAILSGLSESDWIAFPYGKDVADGAQTVEQEYVDYYGEYD